MASATYSKDPYWERTVLFYVNQNEDFTTTINEKERTKIVLLLKGSIIVTYKGAASYVISAPALLFVNEEDIPQVAIKEEIQAIALYFHPSALNDTLIYELLRDPKLEKLISPTTLQDAVLLYPILGIQEYANRSRWMKLSPTAFLRCKTLICQIQTELLDQRDGYWPCRSRSYFIELLIMITNLSEEEKNQSYEAIPEDMGPLLRSALEHIHTNYANRITLEQLSKECGTNRNILTAGFKEKLQLTPMQYLIQLRIHVACSLLTDTELLVTEIALRSGFFDLSHFGRTFKKYMNCSPASYRNQGERK